MPGENPSGIERTAALTNRSIEDVVVVPAIRPVKGPVNEVRTMLSSVSPASRRLCHLLNKSQVTYY